MQAQSKDACMQVIAKAYRTYWPLAHVYLTQPVAKADIISAIDQKRDGRGIVWSTWKKRVFNTGFQLEALPGHIPRKAQPTSSFPPIKGAWWPNLMYAAASRWHKANPSWLAVTKLEASEDRISGRWRRSTITRPSSLRPRCDVLGNVMTKWKGSGIEKHQL